MQIKKKKKKEGELAEGRGRESRRERKIKGGVGDFRYTKS